MDSLRKRRRQQIMRWGLYSLLLLTALAAQTTPGFLAVGAAKPAFILPLCLAVALREGEFPGAFFGAAAGLLWDLSSGRVVGLLALCLMVVCFGAAVVVQLYLRVSCPNFAFITALCALLVLSTDFLFYDIMRSYGGSGVRYLTVTLPTAVFTGAVAPLLLMAVDRVRRATTPEPTL